MVLGFIVLAVKVSVNTRKSNSEITYCIKHQHYQTPPVTTLCFLLSEVKYLMGDNLLGQLSVWHPDPKSRKEHRQCTSPWLSFRDVLTNCILCLLHEYHFIFKNICWREQRFFPIFIISWAQPWFISYVAYTEYIAISIIRANYGLFLFWWVKVRIKLNTPTRSWLIRHRPIRVHD